MDDEHDPKRPRTAERWLRLVSNEGGVFLLHEKGAALCGLLRNIMDPEYDEERTVPIVEANNDELGQAVEFLHYHITVEPCPFYKPLQTNVERELIYFRDAEWLSQEGGKYNLPQLISMYSLSMYLDCEVMRDVCAIKIVCYTGRMNSSELARELNLPPMTKEEEFQYRKANTWIFKTKVIDVAV